MCASRYTFRCNVSFPAWRPVTCYPPGPWYSRGYMTVAASDSMSFGAGQATTRPLPATTVSHEILDLVIVRCEIPLTRISINNHRVQATRSLFVRILTIHSLYFSRLSRMRRFFGSTAMTLILFPLFLTLYILDPLLEERKGSRRRL